MPLSKKAEKTGPGKPTKAELRTLAARASHRRSNISTSAWRRQLSTTYRGLGLLIMAAAYSPISQLTLSPVYGAIPTSLYHDIATTTVVVLALAARAVSPPYSSANIAPWIPVLCFWIPTIQFFLVRWSALLGALWGPIVTESLTYLPLIILSVLSVGPLPAIDARRMPPSMASLIFGALSFSLFKYAQNLSASLFGSASTFSRSGLQLLFGVLYTVMAPSKFLLLVVPCLMHSFLHNVHMPFPSSLSTLNSTLALHSNHAILARRESLTGYISVLENRKDRFRALRCDHSLLGGVWLPLQGDTKSVVREPIYAVFTMLEAVRLVETAQETAEGEAQRQALVIGLGIGTAPSALTAHGVNTTTVEIDPAVHAYATKYFDLPAECHVVIDDAVHFVDAAGNLGREYDYLIHDVFTGGAEPVELFTFEFLKGLHDLLKPDGAIAINYAGDLAMPSGRLVVRTIKAVFPTCRIFREDAGPTSSGSKRDFTNMVVFCTRSSRPLTFRRPVPADFLGSLTRRQSLLPEHEIEAGVFEERKGDGDIIRRGEMGRLEKWHRQSALGHWEIMRTVLPAAVWENW